MKTRTALHVAIFYPICSSVPLTLNVLCISESYTEIKIKLIFFFTLLCGASKGLMKAFKVFIKPFKAPQRRVQIKI